jgi:16S rRNA (uracil1498-N3)-methyltransferase
VEVYNLQFIYLKDGGKDEVQIEGELYTHLFKSRRHKSKDFLFIRNSEEPKFIYKYSISEINRRSATLKLEDGSIDFKNPEKEITLGWCMVDPKTVEKTLPMLNELGVKELNLVYCKFSQRDFKADKERFQKILENSSMQNGRFDTMKIEIRDNLRDFLQIYPNTIVVDFSDDKLERVDNEKISLLIGAEGGFSENERELFKIVKGINSPYILKSGTAIIYAVSKVL